MKYAYTLFLKFSVRCIHLNYLFYRFKCVRRVCPNLSSAPCTYVHAQNTMEKSRKIWRLGEHSIDRRTQVYNPSILLTHHIRAGFPACYIVTSEEFQIPLHPLLLRNILRYLVHGLLAYQLYSDIVLEPYPMTRMVSTSQLLS